MSEDLKSTGTISIELPNEEFSKFTSVLGIVSKMCTDLTVKDGIICQSSDRRSSILNIDISSILGESTVLISGVSSKVDLLEPFRKQGVDMYLDISHNFYSFRDDLSKLEFTKPIEEYLNNKFRSAEELNSKLMVEKNGTIFEYQISKFLIERLTALQRGLSASTIRFEFNGDKADIVVSASDNPSTTTIGKLVTIENLERNVNGICVFPIQPFLLGGDQINVEGIFRGDGENILLKLNTDINEIPINMWCIAKLVEPEEDDDAPF